jgi:hypothetical protein
MRRVGRVLHGDPSVLELLPEPDPGAIGADAARLLCENRIAALLGMAPEAEEGLKSDSPLLLYAISRVYTDIATAELCAAGVYRSGYEERLRWLRGDPEAKHLREKIDRRLVERIALWTDYKLRPSPAVAPYGSNVEMWKEAATDILNAWKRATVSAAGRDPALADCRPIEELIALRPRCGSLRSNLRSWHEYEGARRGRFCLRVLVASSVRALRGAPDDRIRLEAVRLMDAGVTKGMGHRVGRPSGGFPHGGGSWFVAARLTSLAWRRLVYGREM